MSALLLFLSMAFAEPPTQALVELGLDAPTVTTTAPGWRAALPGGGLVRVIQAADEAEASTQFAWQQQTAQSGVWPTADLTHLGVDEAVGDGTASVLVRKGTVVLYIRDLGDDASSWAERILPLL